MGSVFLSSVDDYVEPSQVCVNPAFGIRRNIEEETKAGESEGGGSVRMRKRRPRQALSSAPHPSIKADEAPLGNIVQASIADCLACSGCVTTSETVLLQDRHSWGTLLEWLNQADEALYPEIVFTISPASWADFLRHVFSPDGKWNDSDIADRTVLEWQRRAVAFLHQTLGASVVLDGNIPLEWSRHEAALEFCRHWRKQHAGQGQRRLPLLSSSCPAAVCLVETSIHKAVPFLATSKSPMLMAASYWKHAFKGKKQRYNKDFTPVGVKQHLNSYYHVAVMPCHDKKLEASRKNVADDEQPNLVITTSECLELMLEITKRKSGLGVDENAAARAEIIKQIKESTPVLTFSSVEAALGESNGVNAIQPALVVSATAAEMANRQLDMAQLESKTTASPFFQYSSGGFAEYIFRFAAQELFGVSIEDTLTWRPIVVQGNRGNRPVSARVAAQRRREFHEATLYQLFDGTFQVTKDENGNGNPVLSFVIAYGQQTIQRILAPFEGKGQIGELQRAFDYVEAMACPSGCLNGVGQNRVSQRETPTETRQRVSQNRDWFTTCTTSTSRCFVPEESRHTTFSSIAPLQHYMGSAAGVSVKDAKW